MAKNNQKKRKLKKSYVRKILGGLCLATAIGVAAIPVAKNEAQVDGGTITPRLGEANDYKYESYNDGDYLPATANIEKANGSFITILTKPTDIGLIYNGCYTYEKTENGRKNWHVQEIYDYYEKQISSNEGTSAIVCGHKDMSGKTEISIGEFLYADYVKIPSDQVFNFLNSKINTGSSRIYENCEITLKKINNVIQEGEAIDTWIFDPAAKALSKNTGSSFSEREVVEILFPNEYTAFDEDKSDPAGELKVKIDTEDLQYRLLCELTDLIYSGTTTKGKMKGCTLWDVIDDDANNAIASCFIPQIIGHSKGMSCQDESAEQWRKDGHPAWMLERHDSNGFLCLEKSPTVRGIANDTFRDVYNQVTKINLTGEIAYVGKNAFTGAGMVTTLVAPKLKFIGDEAFKNCANLYDLQWTRMEETGAGYIETNPQIEEIGADAFANSGIQVLEIPTSVKKICTGAFSNCPSLVKIFLEEGQRSNELDISSYAFYNDRSLTEVDWTDGGEKVASIGEAAFAVPYGTFSDKMTMFSFPQGTSGSGNYLDNHILAGRGGSLATVIMPLGDWGTGGADVELPLHTFEGCFALELVDFKPDGAGVYTGGRIKYGSNIADGTMFKDTLSDTFVVHGPELRDLGGGTTDRAWPRQSTWYCTNGVERAIPYTFEKNGETYYEVCKSQPNGDRYVLSVIDRGGVGELVSCERLDTASTDKIDLEIPKNVGEITLASIGNGLFNADPGLKSLIKSLSFEEGSQISEIKSGVFGDCPLLEDISLCSSINKIGSGAFSNLGAGSADKVVDVHFMSDNIDMPDDAFSTADGVGMIFHGEAKDLTDYRPFQVAMEVPINDSLNICYKTNSPSCLTIMLDRKNGLPTLVDYPHYLEIDGREGRYYDGELDSGVGYISYGSTEWNELYGKKDSLSYIARRTLETVTDWKTKYGPGCPEEISLPADYITNNPGPWNYGTPDKSLFSLTQADAARNAPDPGFLTPWYSIDQTGEAILSNAINIKIPNGVKSVDSTNFYSSTPVGGKNNDTNIIKYLSMLKTKYTSIGGDIETKPGLFSGYFEETGSGEVLKRGNDFIKSVDLGTVEYLPDYCFESCENLEKVIMPSCEDIGTLPFKNCPKMNNVDTTGNDKYIFSSQSGIIYEANPDGETYTIIECLQNVVNPTIDTTVDPFFANTSEIEPFAFEDCDNLCNVDFDGVDKLTDIPVACFINCDKLEEVYLPSNVGSMGSKAFSGCNELEDVIIKSREMDPADDAFDRTEDRKDSSGRYEPTIWSYDDYAPIKYAKRLGFKFKLLEDGTCLVRFIGPDGNIIDPPGITSVESGHTAIEKTLSMVMPTIEGMAFKYWNPDINTVLYEDTAFYAVYEPIIPPQPVDDRVAVLFIDWDGTRLAPEQKVAIGGNAVPPANPTRNGYTFTGWNPDYRGVLEDTACVAQYKKDGGDDPTPSGKVTVTFVDWDGSLIDTQTIDSGSSANKPKDPKRSGYTFKDWKPSYKNVTSNTVCVAQYTKDDDDDDDDDDNKAQKMYLVTVIDGLGSGRYVEGATVTVTANPAPNGMSFSYWETQSPSAAIQNTRNQVSTFKMPDNDVTVRAVYKRDDSGEDNLDSNGNKIKHSSNSSDTSDDGVPATPQTNCRVEVTKGGIPAINKITAKVNGSADNFVLKITEAADAEALVRAALEGEYGSPLDEGRILYEAMDISLYDSTGDVPITDYSGLSVDITMPLPMMTAQYGGNNRAALCENAILENLGVTFKDLEGTPAISFTATHFSPYTIYVDLQNLNHDLDTKGGYKTGDPIHPKWFLSIGLACLSGVLFLKKDKKSKLA